MKNRLRGAIRLALVFGCGLAALPAGAADSAATPRYGGTLVLANRDDPPSGFDPMRTSSIALHEVGGALFGPGNLVMRAREDQYQAAPYLATSWYANTGFTEWTFILRSGVYWHDGVPFTAEDVKFWFELACFGVKVGDKARAPAYFAGELGDVHRVDVTGPGVVKITFGQRNPHFLEILANPRFKFAHPKHLMQPLIDRGEVGVSPLDVGCVGLGPFQLERYDRGSLVRVRRFDRYWERDAARRSLPYLDRIDFVVMTEPLTMDLAFRAGRIDGGARGQGHNLSVERLAAYQRDLGNTVFYARTEGGNFRLAFNMLRPGPWQDVRVRRAISLWIDRRAAIPLALGGFGWTSPDLGPPDLPVPRHFTNWPKFDLRPLAERRSEARRLMAEAGYARGFTMGHLVRGLNPATGEFLKAQLAGLGVDLRLQVVDEGEWNRARVSLDYDSQQGRLTPSPIPEGTESVYGRYSLNPDAYAKHEDPKVDDLYRRLRQALSYGQRVALWRDIERYLFADMAYVIPIAESIDVVPYRTYVKGLVIPVEDAHTHTDFATVWLDGKDAR